MNIRLLRLNLEYKLDYSKNINEIKDLLEKISKDIVTSNSNNGYSSQKQKILRIFKTTGGDNYNQESIELRLIVIDSLYSTQMGKRYFPFEDLSSEIYSLGTVEKEVIKKIQSFRNSPDTALDIFNMFDDKEYGIQKNGKSAGGAKSLLSKYFYFQLMLDTEDKTGFPIYDKLAKNMYQPVCNYVGLTGKRKLSSTMDINIFSYLNMMKELAAKLDICGQYPLQNFDILDAYLWRMGKFSEGNFSLLLNKEEYLTLIKAFNLYEYEKDKNNTVELNILLKDAMLKGYKKVLDNDIFCELWKHWLNLNPK